MPLYSTHLHKNVLFPLEDQRRNQPQIPILRPPAAPISLPKPPKSNRTDNPAAANSLQPFAPIPLDPTEASCVEPFHESQPRGLKTIRRESTLRPAPKLPRWKQISSSRLHSSKHPLHLHTSSFVVGSKPTNGPAIGITGGETSRIWYTPTRTTQCLCGKEAEQDCLASTAQTKKKQQTTSLLLTPKRTASQGGRHRG